MQSSKAFLLSPSPTPLRRTTTRFKQPLNPNPNPSFLTLNKNKSVSVSVSFSNDLHNSINGVSSSSFRKSSLSPSLCSSFSSSSSSGSLDSIPSLVSGRGGDDFSVKATAKTEEAGESSDSKSLSKTLELGVLLVFWYGFNIYFNIFNKQVLKVYPYPLTISAFQFGVGTVLILLMWMFNLHKKPKISTSQLLVILPLAILHTLGNLFTNMSLGKVSVSFTHTIKAMEPFFSVLFSAMFLGEAPTVWVVMSLLPVVGGVALASLTEASFNWIGFLSAMVSNMTNQSRNVLSKKLMVKKEEALDNINLFSVLTIMSFFLMTPVALYMEGIKFSPSYLQSAGFNVRELCVRALLAGVFFHTYQQLSYMILGRVSPVTHSVSNCVKRVVVIVSSVIFFRTPVSPINAIGTGVALAGVFLYSRVKQLKPKRKTV